LKRTDVHARNGVMKARWSQEDFEAMEKKPLEFTATDLDLIRAGVHQLQERAGYPAIGAHEW
jgi:hypothetical protein